MDLDNIKEKIHPLLKDIPVKISLNHSTSFLIITIILNEGVEFTNINYEFLAANIMEILAELDLKDITDIQFYARKEESSIEWESLKNISEISVNSENNKLDTPEKISFSFTNLPEKIKIYVSKNYFTLMVGGVIFSLVLAVIYYFIAPSVSEYVLIKIAERDREMALFLASYFSDENTLKRFETVYVPTFCKARRGQVPMRDFNEAIDWLSINISLHNALNTTKKLGTSIDKLTGTEQTREVPNSVPDIDSEQIDVLIEYIVYFSVQHSCRDR